MVAAGLSPRVRGNLPHRVGRSVGYGSIPARAGEPDSLAPFRKPCGGLSPRVRGNRGVAQRKSRPGRSIPARAGEPSLWQSRQHWRPVYPRACGGTVATIVNAIRVGGLSPRVRGNQSLVNRAWRIDGSIPARAGEPKKHITQRVVAGVYPRACGGTCAAHSHSSQPKGLSPRVRGNRDGADSRADPAGSIPARAGEPLSLLIPRIWK